LLYCRHWKVGAKNSGHLVGYWLMHEVLMWKQTWSPPKVALIEQKQNKTKKNQKPTKQNKTHHFHKGELKVFGSSELGASVKDKILE